MTLLLTSTPNFCGLNSIFTYHFIFIAICYFPPTTSNFAIYSNGDPYQELYKDITRHATKGQVLLLGYFNVCTSCMHVPIDDLIEEEMQTQESDL